MRTYSTRKHTSNSQMFQLIFIQCTPKYIPVGCNGFGEENIGRVMERGISPGESLLQPKLAQLDCLPKESMIGKYSIYTIRLKLAGYVLCITCSCASPCRPTSLSGHCSRTGTLRRSRIECGKFVREKSPHGPRKRAQSL